MTRDIVIVGAGPVGASLALALADADLDIALLDARAPEVAPRGERSLALSHGARLIFERIGIWCDLAADRSAVTPIHEIDVSQAGGFGLARLTAAEQGLPALGYVVSYRALQSALDAALARRNVFVRRGATASRVGGTPAYAAIEIVGDPDPWLARLAVVADGNGDNVAGIVRERHDYARAALIARVWCDRPHGGVAFERFTPEGPVALLPEQDHYGLVWTAPPNTIEALLALDDTAFLQRLRERFGRHVRFERVAERRSFPLALEFARSATSTRCAVIGNAAQMLHPVAGQGFNLGLRDAYGLARVVIDTPRDALGTDAMLARYGASRRTDRAAGVAFTHGLLGVFGSASPWLRWPRGLALTVLDALPPVKRAFTHGMLYGLR
jgi:2-octaprenyl-6-methoxyphenol hydroxylase